LGQCGQFDKCGQCGQLGKCGQYDHKPHFGWKSRKGNCLLLRKWEVLHISFHAAKMRGFLTDWQGLYSLSAAHFFFWQAALFFFGSFP